MTKSGKKNLFFKAEKALCESEARYKALLEGTTEGILVADLESKKFHYANPALCKMFGYTVDEIIQLGVEDIHPKEFLEHVIAEFIAQSKGEKALAHDIPCLRKDGTIFYADINTTSIVLDGDECNLGFFSDITEHKRAVDKLRESEERYRDIVETTAEWIWEIDLNMKHTFSNPRVKDILGYSVEEFLEANTLGLIHPEDAEIVGARLPEIIAKKKGWQGWVLRWRHKDGSYRFLESNAVPILKNNGELAGFRGADRDISERRISEDKIKSSLQEKETLLAELYHRTKNNMQIITAILKLKSAHFTDSSVLNIFEDVIMRIEAMALVQEKLFKSKNLSRIDMREYIEELIQIISHNYLIDPKKIVFRLEMEPVQTNIDVATPCGLILNELITNSLKHAFPGDRNGEVYVKLWRDADQKIRLIYRDNGVGVEDENKIKKSDSLGLLTLFSIVEHQLKGQVTYKLEKGIEYSLEFEDYFYRERV